MENQNIGLFDLGSGLFDYNLDRRIYKNVHFDFLIFVVGPLKSNSQNHTSIYDGKRQFHLTINHECFKNTKIFLVLNQMKTSSHKRLISIELQKKYFKEMFELDQINKKVELLLFDISQRKHYLEFWKKFYEFILKK